MDHHQGVHVNALGPKMHCQEKEVGDKGMVFALTQRGPEVVFGPSVCLEAWGYQDQKTIIFINMFGVFALVPQAFTK